MNKLQAEIVKMDNPTPPRIPTRLSTETDVEATPVSGSQR